MIKPSTRNRSKGAGRELKGALKQAAGRLTGNRSLQVRGAVQKAVGKAQRKVGEAERDVEKDLNEDVD